MSLFQAYAGQAARMARKTFGDVGIYARGDSSWSVNVTIQGPDPRLQDAAAGITADYVELWFRGNELPVYPAIGDTVTVGDRVFAVHEIDGLPMVTRASSEINRVKVTALRISRGVGP